MHSESTSALGLVRRVTVPVVVKFHGNYLGLVRAQVLRALHGSPFREVKAFVSLTRIHFARGNCWAFRDCEWMVPSRHQLAGTRLSHVMRAERGHVVPNGVDAGRFRSRERRPAGDPVLVTSGRLNREKGFDVAIRALAYLPGASLRILGDGEERRALERLAGELGVADRVRFLGSRPAATWRASLRKRTSSCSPRGATRPRRSCLWRRWPAACPSWHPGSAASPR